MEVPLTPLEFARRAAALYGSREAVVDGDRGGSRIDAVLRSLRSLVAALAGAWRSGRATGSPTSRRTRTRSSNRSTRVPQIGAVLVPINYRLTADDFAYIINHTGATVVCAHADYLECRRRHRPRPTMPAGGGHFVGAREGRGGQGWLDYEERCVGRDASATRRIRRPPIDENDLLTINYTSGTTVAAQGRDDHASQRLHERGRHACAPADDRRRSRICGRCRCSTPTAGRSCGS